MLFSWCQINVEYHLHKNAVTELILFMGANNCKYKFIDLSSGTYSMYVIGKLRKDIKKVCDKKQNLNTDSNWKKIIFLGLSLVFVYKTMGISIHSQL